MIESINEKVTDNIYNIVLLNKDKKEKKKVGSFFKFSPLLDPVKYMVGKYSKHENIQNLPVYDHESKDTHKKIKDKKQCRLCG